MRYHWGSGVGHTYSHSLAGVTPVTCCKNMTPIGSRDETDKDTNDQGAHHDSPDYPDAHNVLPRETNNSFEEHDTLENPKLKANNGTSPGKHTNSEDPNIQNTNTDATNGHNQDEEQDEESRAQNVDSGNDNDREERDDEDEDEDILEGSDSDLGQEELKDDMFGEVKDGAFSYD